MTMADGNPDQPQAGQADGPQYQVLMQYVKDFSFENPNAPRSLTPSQTQPQINIQVNVGVQQVGQSEYEVSLMLEGKAENAGTVLFAFEINYAGVFHLKNVPQEHMQPLLLIESPRLLFPFAREIIATTVRNGGFALLLEPIDFVALYQQRLAQANAQGGTPPVGPAPTLS